MKKLISFLGSIALVFATVSPGWAWGPDGHSTVGKIASLRIKQHTKDKIAGILRPGETLAGIANWADTVKDRIGQHDSDSDTDEFLQDEEHNKNTRDWHFDDLPLGCTSYDTCEGFKPEADVVHLINICIHTLQGQPDPNQPLSERNALRMLVHLVGDLHQPLHVGSGYINVNGPNHSIVIATDPALILQRHFPKDLGANLLMIDRQKNLHSFWDGDLVKALMTATHKPTSDALATFLKSSVAPQPEWNGHGSVDTWAAEFATDSLNQSRDHAYKSVMIVKSRVVTKNHKRQTVFDITRASDYDSLNREEVRQQLAKGGFRLAKMLDEVFAH
ncbi:MAG: S1/P1 nuclease [Acidobacteriota bacterium]|nr:S1/P1 nuclease [Acidobacteriota bacterium]